MAVLDLGMDSLLKASSRVLAPMPMTLAPHPVMTSCLLHLQTWRK